MSAALCWGRGGGCQACGGGIGLCLLDTSLKGKAEYFEMEKDMRDGCGDEEDGGLKGLLLDALSRDHSLTPG